MSMRYVLLRDDDTKCLERLHRGFLERRIAGSFKPRSSCLLL